MYLCVHLSVRFPGGDTDECGSTQTSAALEGWPPGPPYWLRHTGGSGIDSFFNSTILLWLLNTRFCTGHTQPLQRVLMLFLTALTCACVYVFVGFQV